MFLPALAVSMVAVPVGGSLLLARTYRTDAALQAMPMPRVTKIVGGAATACSVIIMVGSPALGWSLPAAAIIGPLFGAAFLTDTAGRVLPDLLTGALCIAGLGLAFSGLGLPVADAMLGLIGFAGGLGLLRHLMLARYGADAFGLGDVKLIAAAATIMPVPQILISLVVAAPIALGVILWRSIRPTDDPSLPFGSLFVAAFAAVILIAPGLPVLGG